MDLVEFPILIGDLELLRNRCIHMRVSVYSGCSGSSRVRQDSLDIGTDILSMSNQDQHGEGAQADYWCGRLPKRDDRERADRDRDQPADGKSSE